MSRSIFVGDTDYSRQSLDDMVNDLKDWANLARSTQSFFEQKQTDLEKSNYLITIPSSFRILIDQTLQLLKTSSQELEDILTEIPEEVREDHVRRLRSLAIAAHKLANNYGTVWHNDYLDKNYGNNNFILVEALYEDGRGALYDMIDLHNLSDRLVDFVGKKSKKNDLIELKPNFYGIGINLDEIKNKILKKFRRNK